MHGDGGRKLGMLMGVLVSTMGMGGRNITRGPNFGPTRSCMGGADWILQGLQILLRMAIGKVGMCMPLKVMNSP